MGKNTDAQAAQVIDAIKADIIVGRLRPRERLVEDDIVSKFQTSRHLVRAAFVTLERMGLIVRRPNRGAIVRDFSVEQVSQIYEVRMILQAEAARRLPLPATGTVLADLDAIHDDYCRALACNDLLLVNTLNDAFHRRIWATCPNAYLADTIERLWVETTGIRWYGVGDVSLLAASRQDHERMIAQLRDGDREGFVALSVAHILPPFEAFRRAHAFGHLSPRDGSPSLRSAADTTP